MAERQPAPEPIVIRRYEPDMDRMVAALKIALGIKGRPVTLPVRPRPELTVKAEKAVNQ